MAKDIMSTNTHPQVAALLARADRLGSDPANTHYAGGNASAKGEVTDPVTARPVQLLWVKGSGGDLVGFLRLQRFLVRGLSAVAVKG